jgi:hypothetical protein
MAGYLVGSKEHKQKVIEDVCLDVTLLEVIMSKDNILLRKLAQDVFDIIEDYVLHDLIETERNEIIENLKKIYPGL